MNYSNRFFRNEYLQMRNPLLILSLKRNIIYRYLHARIVKTIEYLMTVSQQILGYPLNSCFEIRLKTTEYRPPRNTLQTFHQNLPPQA